MASSTQIVSSADWAELLPEVQLEVRQGGARPATYALSDVDFVIGGVPGCDLRIGTETPAVLCVFARHPAGVTLRKLAMAHSVLVNCQSVSQRELVDGDRIKIGGLDLTIRIAAAPAAAAPADIENAKQTLQDQIQQFREQVVLFQREKEAFERERQRGVSAKPALPVDDWDDQRADLLAQSQERERLLEERADEITRQQKELTTLRQEMADLRTQLYDHYQDRREQLTTLQEDIEEKKLALEEREKKLRLDEQDATERRLRDRRRSDDLDQRATELDEKTRELDEQRSRYEDERGRLHGDWQGKHADLVLREKTLADHTRDFEIRMKQYEADILRLNRLESGVEQREADVKLEKAEVARQRERLQSESAELAEQLAQLDEWHVKLAEEADRLNVQKTEQDAVQRDQSERAAALEGQQTTLTVLRGRLERTREEIRVREQELDEQRARQEARQTELDQRTAEMDKLQIELQAEQAKHATDRQSWLERSAVIDAAVRQMKQTQEQLDAEADRQRRESERLDEDRRKLAESDAILQGRLAQLAETQARMDLERQALSDRGVNLVQREEACIALQEQLHRRSEEIDDKHKEIGDRLQEYQTKFAELEQLRAQVDQRDREVRQQIETWNSELEQRTASLQQKHAEVAGFDEKHQADLTHLALERKTLGEERALFHQEQHASLAKLAQARDELDALRRETLELAQQLPDAEVRAGAAADRLSDARAQLRNHLGEIHEYVRQCQDELEKMRGRLQGDLDRLAEQEQALRRSQDEHRLGMAAFRQQLIDWQGQIADLKRLLARDETRLERKQAKAEERARQMEAESQRLAQQAEELQEQERDVADRREEVDRHLVDMRQWYRHKLRELAGIPLVPDTLHAPPAPPQPHSEDGEDDGIVPIGRGILSITASADPSDQRLGQILRESQLIDLDTLTALLAEARRQRRSLRQVLLASGVVTLYQLALIEAGNLDGLMLGPVRVLDRVRHTAHEGVFRVFDPRRGAEAVLRHLAEADMTDPVKPDEFRQRFAQTMLNDPHLANTLEVLEVSGRPAALQEWLSGLPATDWPPLAAAPGVCYRLLTQAAQGLATAHRAGVIHGHLSDGMLLLTGEGVLKIRGLGEPPWLVGVTHDEEPTARDDLRALGKIVAGWCTPSGVRRGAKTKPLPEALVSILYRLAADGDAGYRDAQALLADLHHAAPAIPANSEAWDRLLKYVREHGAAEATLRQSA